MAKKMFYTMEEVCEILGQSEEEIRAMVESGQINELKDGDDLVFRSQQIDLLTASDETGEIQLDLEGHPEGSAMGLSSSDLSMTDSREGTGVSIFDTGQDIKIDSSEETQVGDALEEGELDLESIGSGSGLLDLTRESDDTSLGAELLEEVYAGDEDLDVPVNTSELFESSSLEPAAQEGATMAAAVPMVVEQYDGVGSGWGTGILVGACTGLILVLIIIVITVKGGVPELALSFAENLPVWTGGLLGIAVVLALIGGVIGRASE